MSDGLPNLLVIGAYKCGTTSLHRYLSLHPDIYMAERKELNFFIDGFAWGNWSRGMDWYLQQFADGTSCRYRGEASPSYTRWDTPEQAAERIVLTLPNAKLIYMVRDPIARMKSNYLELLYDRAWPDVTIDMPLVDIVARRKSPEIRHVYDVIARTSFYSRILEFYDHFLSRGNLLVLRTDMLAGDREAAMAKVAEFLGIGPFPLAVQTALRQNVSSNKRFRRFDLVTPLRGGSLVERVFARIPESVKARYRRLVEFRLDDNRLSALTPGQEQSLRRLFRNDYRRTLEIGLAGGKT